MKLLQQITTQQDNEQWASSAKESESVNVSADSASATTSKTPQRVDMAVVTKFERVSKIKIVLGTIFAMLGVLWLMMNTTVLTNGIFLNRPFTMEWAKNIAVWVIVFLLSDASARVAAPVIDRWITSCTKQIKKC